MKNPYCLEIATKDGHVHKLYGPAKLMVPQYEMLLRVNGTTKVFMEAFSQSEHNTPLNLTICNRGSLVWFKLSADHLTIKV